VIVLSISLLVSVIGIAALTALRVQIRTNENTNDCEEARLYACSGVELARYWINSDVDWRKTQTSGTTITKSFGNGTFTITMTDPTDGELKNSPLDPVTITAIGYRRKARQAIQVTLVPNPTGYSCISGTAVCAGAVNLTGSAAINSDPTVYSDGTIVLASSASIDAPVEAVGACTGANFYRSKTTGATARTFPDPTTVFDYYIANGTAIALKDISGSKIEKCLLSPTSNPWGATNPLGIYVVDCANNKIIVQDCRIVGTLVLLNAKSDSVLDGNVNLAPAVSNFPALMVKGTITMQSDSTTMLSESTTGCNMNPAGTPYNGTNNSTKTDTYPSIINGLVYVSGDLTIKGHDQNFGGPIIVEGTLVGDHIMTVTSSATFATPFCARWRGSR
jgi:hypothetical protein